MNKPYQPSCRHFPTCSGCSHALSVSVPPLWQEILLYCEGKVKPLLKEGSPLHWRCRAKLAVRGSVQNPHIGLFKRYSHVLVPIPDCLVHHPKINQAVELIRQWMIHHQVVPYQETEGSGELRYLQLVVERETGKVQASFVVHLKASSERWKQLLEALQADQPELWHSLWLNFNDRKTNTIFGETWLKICGEELLWEKFGHVHVCYLPATFGQANLHLFEKMLERIYQWIPSHAKVTEYFAGVGAIGLYLAEKCAWVRCEEANPKAEGCFLHSKDCLPQLIASRLSYATLPAEKALHLMEEATTIIVDPPRKGLTPPVKKALIHSSARQIIYVSCGWESFKRDCDDFLNNGLTLKELEGYTFFPGSDHIEVLAHFERNLSSESL